MSSSLNFELVRFLDSTKALYPGGIPRASLTRTSTKQPSGTNSIVVEFLIADTDLESGTDPFFGSTGELLKGIITQGLKLKLSEVNLSIAVAGHAPVLKSQTAAVVVFGLPALALKLTHNRVLIRAATLTEILNDKAAKRQFWNQLQAIQVRTGGEAR